MYSLCAGDITFCMDIYFIAPEEVVYNIYSGYGPGVDLWSL